MTREATLALAFAAVLAIALPAAAQQPVENPFQQHVARGEEWLKRKKYPDAVREFRAAARLNPPAAQSYWGLARVYYETGDDWRATDECRHVLGRTKDPVLLADAHNLLGAALYGRWDLGAAEKEFRAALALDSSRALFRFNLGTVLLVQGNNDGGVAELKAALASEPNASFAFQAQRYIENPRSAREKFLPNFSMTTLDGRQVSLEQLRGKVVVLAFWATWSARSLVAIADLRELAEKFSRAPVVFISVSADVDEQVLRDFVAAHQMDWTQVWDREEKLIRLFGIKHYPALVVVDDEGILRFGVAARLPPYRLLEGEIRSALRARTKRAEPLVIDGTGR